MKFFKAYDRPKCKPCKAGDKEYISYIEKTDPITGKTFLVENERTNIRDYINSNYEETRIENILARAGAGDVNALNRMRGIYADLTGVPRNIAEAHAAIKNAYAEFDQMPSEIRNEFNNNPAEFIAGFANGKVNNVLAKMTKTQAEITNAAEQIDSEKEGK